MAYRFASKLVVASSIVAFGLSACGHDYSEPAEDFLAASNKFVETGDVEEVIDSLAIPLIKSGRNIGMVIGVTTPDGDYIKSYGHIDRERKIPMPKDAIFQVGSITK